jgi:PAS domain S-box-containing protein
MFSEAYLRTLTSDPQLLARFSSFLSRYEPSIAPLVVRYIEIQKVINAVSYANAVANSLPSEGDASSAAQLSKSFQESSQHAFDTLLNTAIPAWVTYNLVKISTSILIAEITNQSSPLTRDLVGGLSEVFCITDPNQKDNPIVYASEEFYRLTGYGRDNVIGYNCRFLQGTRTRKESVRRLKDAIGKGEEICETLLNYRRDGKPFVNMLLLAPLHDDKSNVKYYLGAQVDASQLIEGAAGGKGMEGLERCLVRREMEEQKQSGGDKNAKQIVLEKLRDLSMTFDLEESAVVQSQSRRNSISRTEDEVQPKVRAARRRLDDEDEAELGNGGDDIGNENESTLPEWKISQKASTGKLPGIYEKYLLVRPYPSLRTIFVSQGARNLGKI